VFGIWWWELDGTGEPLQEDLIVYEKFIELRKERERMTAEKERQRASRKSGVSRSGTRYNIPDPQE